MQNKYENEKRTERVSFRTSDRAVQALDRLASQKEWKPSYIVHKAVIEFFERNYPNLLEN